MKAKTVGIIGGGLSSLTAAVRLAGMGFQVKLYEKNSMLGGKMNQYTQDGFRFDTGPSLLTMPFIVEELFSFAGATRDQSPDLIPVAPICKYFFPDKSEFGAYSDGKRMNQEFNRLFPQEKKNYVDFLKYCERIFNASAELFLFTPLHELKKILTPKIIPALVKFYQIDPFRTVSQAVHSYFTDPRLIQLFCRYATYNGSNPFKAPATLNIISYVEYVLGGYYIRGGMYQLVEKLSKLATSLGVEIHTSSLVEKIKYQHQQVTGLVVNNEFIQTDYILCGTDVVEAFDRLIEGQSRTITKLKALEPSLSGLVFLWGLRGKHPQLEHHNIFFSKNYEEEFQQIFRKLQTPDDPTIYIAISSKNDPDHAPADCENWFVLINVPYLNGRIDWGEQTNRMKQIILQKLKIFGLDIGSHIIFEKTITPEDFLRIYRSNQGSIYGISSNSRMTAFKRHSNRSKQIKNLYFAGGSVHPGGGIPLVMLSGKMASELIAENEGIHAEANISMNKWLEKHPKVNLQELANQFLNV